MVARRAHNPKAPVRVGSPQQENKRGNPYGISSFVLNIVRISEYILKVFAGNFFGSL